MIGIEMTISSNQLFMFELGISFLGLIVILMPQNRSRTRTITLLALASVLAAEVLTSIVNYSELAEQSSWRLSVFIVLGSLLASFYTPAYMSSRRVFSKIILLNLLSLSVLQASGTQIVWLAIPGFFALLAIGNRAEAGMPRILGIFGVVCTMLFYGSLLMPGIHTDTSHLLELIGLVLFIGLFPVSPWFSRLYETESMGVLASAFIVQAAVVFALEQQQSLVRDVVLMALPVFAILSVLLALAHSSARRALSGLASSQLAFLVYASSGQHYSDLAAVLLGQSMMVTIPGLILAVGALEARVGRLNLTRPSGQFESYPKLAFVILLFGLMGAGFPLSMAYIAEDLVLESGFHEYPMMGASWLLVTALTAIVVIKLYLYLCHGSRDKEPGIDILPSKLFAATFVTLVLVVSSIILPG